MNVTCIILGVVFCIAGMAFFIGKGHIWLNAWKNMPEDEKIKIRILPLCRNIGGMVMLCGGIFFISGLSAAFKSHVFIWAMIAWLILAGLDVYYIGKSKRYIRESPVTSAIPNRSLSNKSFRKKRK